MNRHYDGEQVRSVLQKLRNIRRTDGMALNIGADLIVGFPDESDSDFFDTETIVREFGISQLHAFPFSAHIDHYHVPAGTFPNQVPNHITQARLKHLMTVGHEAFLSLGNATLGKTVRVLVEKCSLDGTIFSGWSENYLFCNETNITLFSGQVPKPGSIVEGIYHTIIEQKSPE